MDIGTYHNGMFFHTYGLFYVLSAHYFAQMIWDTDHTGKVCHQWFSPIGSHQKVLTSRFSPLGSHQWVLISGFSPMASHQ